MDSQDGGNKDLANDQENKGSDIPVRGRPDVSMAVGKYSDRYNMQHAKRGYAIIFVHSEYLNNARKPRATASLDADVAKEAFEALKFEVELYENLSAEGIKERLREVAERDHSNCDALAIVFMSHGGVKERNKKEFVWAYDKELNTMELWVNFTAERCHSLAGKPKMYFIQACRGNDEDKGVRAIRSLCLSIDRNIPKEEEEEYVIPFNADQLVMWASYPGFPAFKRSKGDFKGSVFIHFLAKALKEAARTPGSRSLSSILLQVTREVAVDFESNTGGAFHCNKQVPYIHSTLLRDVYF